MVTTAQLLALAQYALAAAHANANNRLDPTAAALLGEWTEANSYIAKLTGEFGNSVAAKITRRAFGALMAPQAARDRAVEECAALLENNEHLKDVLADGDWAVAADTIVLNTLLAYHLVLDHNGRPR